MLSVSVREQIKSAAVSFALGLWTTLLGAAGIAFAEGSLATPALTWSWLQTHWWGILIGFLVGGATSATYRAQQAKTRVANTVQLGDGTTAVVTPAPSPPPPKAPP